jgi:peptidylprolyl isomerase
MIVAKKGSTVKVHYTGTLEDGTQFDSSAGRDPLEFTVGGGNLIRGFDRAVLGMGVGESKTVKIPADDAYGSRREELVMTVKRKALPTDVDPTVGEELELQQGDEVFVVRVTDVSEDDVTLDANHPLAGKTLIFEIELLEVA